MKHRPEPTDRQPHEAPEAIAAWGWRYHHLGVPTRVAHPGERYLERFKMYVTGFESSPYGVEWMRFDDDSPVSELIRTVPHLAFEVDDLDEALRDKHVLTAPNSPSPGVRVAMILHDGAPIELLELGLVTRTQGDQGPQDRQEAAPPDADHPPSRGGP